MKIFLGFVGAACVSVCDTNPCDNNAQCVEDQKSLRGYHCQCNSSSFTGMCLIFIFINLLFKFYS